MTLLDARRGILATFAEVSARTGVAIGGELAVTRLGPPLEHELAHWFPADEVDTVAALYRELYAVHAVPVSEPMPDAVEAVAAVRREGGRVVVVTAKNERLARASLAVIGIEPDVVVGQRFADTKGDAIRDHGVGIFVGDHEGDMIGARAGGALAVGLTTGPHDAGTLTAAGADVVLGALADFPGWLADRVLETRLAALTERLRALGSVLVAFSGGADSAFLLAWAARTLGADAVVAATAVSASLPAGELTAARDFAERLGVRHVLPATDEQSRPGYRANGPDRCYFCKAELADTLGPLAAELGLGHVVTGTNADDAVAGFRPGIQAAAERGAATPLLDAGLTKRQVRAASRRLGLVTADKPAAACLASRIAYGIEVTPSRLARVERAETALRAALADAGLESRDLRVRDLGDRARIEVDARLAVTLAARPDLMAAVDGFGGVEVDPRGFRSGSMNELLP
ncbi:ATP-dependent sacrificial sulfur transferase LarE [Frankia sp. CNm7]|uniref:ATP-dependent sacrificial sulfur transferase LarE n=2 Tax=Frankia nepalensis TaxID=1836974 RepID=A0A937RLJ8_9ACTN|nr:ATP-dependent sacrificial sulfur transferase LarE [Frankia nepalensis]MBL7516373.1 ATP-dependent sacrificial sulfur transferase LarE [Frankia nepalensis]MBL7521363.1 ATP-dependent sacrificial sulfur transferase LarE [Frankia nepalensis]MBL7628136.1 ATP-dependent sacrificial sulfur transferase LarE [Frankia nepalensis]